VQIEGKGGREKTWFTLEKKENGGLLWRQRKKVFNPRDMEKRNINRVVMEELQETVSRDGYFFESLIIFIGTFCLFADTFQDFSKAFSLPYTVSTCICFLEITY
jgi:hypothetical protein